ncbi:MAG: hypothetical protein LBJ73_01560, partial [Rickettsiales bacterium]|nr:hypothetical protein [Rickettsiales bacterium]
PEDLKDYYLQDVCASTSGTYPETSCSITRINQNNDLNDDEFYCWCRLKRIDDKLAYDGWVFNGSRSSAEICAQRCAYFCVANTTYNSNLRSALLSAFGL